MIKIKTKGPEPILRPLLTVRTRLRVAASCESNSGRKNYCETIKEGQISKATQTYNEERARFKLGVDIAYNEALGKILENYSRCMNKC